MAEPIKSSQVISDDHVDDHVDDEIARNLCQPI